MLEKMIKDDEKDQLSVEVGTIFHTTFFISDFM